LGACLSAQLTTSGILRFSSDASENLRNVAPPSSHLRVASAFAWTSTNCRWTVSHDSSRVHQCVALLGLQSLRDSGSLGLLADPVVFFTPLLRCVNLSAQRGRKNTLSTCSSPSRPPSDPSIATLKRSKSPHRCQRYPRERSAIVITARLVAEKSGIARNSCPRPSVLSLGGCPILRFQTCEIGTMQLAYDLVNRNVAVGLLDCPILDRRGLNPFLHFHNLISPRSSHRQES
jgi:hypothetical protein